jgi:hypothetical protein
MFAGSKMVAHPCPVLFMRTTAAHMGCFHGVESSVCALSSGHLLMCVQQAAECMAAAAACTAAVAALYHPMVDDQQHHVFCVVLYDKEEGH